LTQWLPECLGETFAGWRSLKLRAYPPARKEYRGILQLEITETIAVKAISFLITRMPDPSKGYALSSSSPSKAFSLSVAHASML